MKKIRYLLAVSFMMVTAFANAQNQQRYELKSGIIKCEMITQGVKMVGTQYFDNYGAKESVLMEVDMPMGKSVIRTLQFSDTTYQINMSQKVGQKVILPEKPVNYLHLTPDAIVKYKIKELGSEIVAGRKCTKYSLEMSQAGQTANTEVWVWKGIVLKSVIKMGLVELVNQTVIEVQENANVDPKEFEIPDGITMM